MNLEPGGPIAWLIVGLIAGALASWTTRSRAGCFASLLLGWLGACLGGFLFSLLGFRSDAGFWGSIFVAFVGAVVVVFVGRIFTGRL